MAEKERKKNMLRRGRPAKKKKSPMQLSLQLLRREGHRCAIVEKWNPFAKIRQDLFGFGDILALTRNKRREAIIIQTTTMANINSRVNKIRESDAWLDWLVIPNHRIEVHGWALKKERGTKRFHYEVRRIEVSGV